MTPLTTGDVEGADQVPVGAGPVYTGGRGPSVGKVVKIVSLIK